MIESVYINKINTDIDLNGQVRCSLHSLEKLNSFCRDCQQVLCTTCLVSGHKHHDWCELKDAGNIAHKQLLEVLHEVGSKWLACLKVREEQTSTLLEEIEEENRSVFGEIDKQCDKIIRFVNVIREKLKLDVTSRLDAIHGLQDQLQSKKTNLESMFRKSLKVVQRNKVSEVIQTNLLLRKAVDELHSYEFTFPRYYIEFKGGTIDFECLMDMIGYNNKTVSSSNKERVVYDLQSTESKWTLQNKFTLRLDKIEAICPIGNKAWIYNSRAKAGGLMKTNGEVLGMHNLNFVFFDVAKTDNDELIMSDPRNSMVKKISHDGHIDCVLNTSPLYPTGICISPLNSDLFVCLMSLTDTGSQGERDTGNQSERKIIRINVEGNLTQTIENDDVTGDRLFQYLRLVRENFNGDIVVANKITSMLHNIIVVNSMGKLKFRYEGSEVLNQNVFPSDIRCDDLCRIMVSDFNNHVIIFLHPDTGDLLQILMSLDDGIRSPARLGLQGNELWIGYGGNKVMIVTLKSKYKDVKEKAVKRESKTCTVM